jgi:hypothetical protein
VGKKHSSLEYTNYMADVPAKAILDVTVDSKGQKLLAKQYTQHIIKCNKPYISFAEYITLHNL